MSWAEIKKAVNSDLNVPLDKKIAFPNTIMNRTVTYINISQGTSEVSLFKMEMPMLINGLMLQSMYSKTGSATDYVYYTIYSNDEVVGKFQNTFGANVNETTLKQSIAHLNMSNQTTPLVHIGDSIISATFYGLAKDGYFNTSIYNNPASISQVFDIGDFNFITNKLEIKGYYAKNATVSASAYMTVVLDYIPLE